MATVYIIDDQYVKSKMPSLSRYDNKDILSTILLEQETTLVSDITEELYDDIVAKLIAAEVTPIEEPYTTLITLCQRYLLMLTMQGIYSFYEKNSSENEREYNISNLYGKVKFTQKKLKNYITDNNFTTTGDTFDGDVYNFSPIWYPR